MDNSLTKVKAKKQLIQFLLLTFTLSWGIWIPALLLENYLEGSIIGSVVMLGIFAPSTSAIIMVFKESGIKGVKGFLSRCLKPKAPLWIYLLLVVFSLFMLLSHVINTQLGTAFPEVITNPIQIVVIIIIQLVIITITEEFGWRGYAQQRIDVFFGEIPAGLILGTIWGAWHIPAFLYSSMPHYYMPFLHFFIMVVVISVFASMAQRKVSPSIWPTILLHGLINAGLEIIPFMKMEEGADYTAWILFNGMTVILLITVLSIRRIRVIALSLDSIK